MAKRGRPVKSVIRDNMCEVLYFMKKGTGYDIYKVYREIFPNVTMRVIYYHLKKGVSLQEFEVAEIKKEKGDYSWGSDAEKIYYKLGPNSHPKGNARVREFYQKKA